MKYDLGQLIYYCLDMRLHSATVLSRMQVDNLHEDWACTEKQKEIFMAFGEAGVFYKTCHGVINEKDAYPSRAELLWAMFESEHNDK